MKVAVAAGAAVVGGGAVACSIIERRDRRAVDGDPEGEELGRVCEGRATRVRSDDGTELHVEAFGDGAGCPVVLVHGWMCSMRLWHRQIRDLSPDHPVVAYDLRGHGRSGPAAGGDHSMDALAADLDAVLHQAVGHDVPVVLAGHSMGAMSIVAWARAHPGEVARRVAGAVLANAGVEELVGQARIVAVGDALSKAREAFAQRLLGWPVPLPSRPRAVVSRVVRAVALGPAASPAQVAFSTDMVLACPTEVRAGFGSTLSTLDLLDGLDALGVPTVVVAAEHDRLTPPVHARRIAAALADATLVEIPDAGHLTPIEAHAEITALIGELARRHS